MSWNVEDRHIGKLILNLQAVKFNFNVIFVYNLWNFIPHNNYKTNYKVAAQLTITCSKLAKETVEEGVNYIKS